MKRVFLSLIALVSLTAEDTIERGRPLTLDQIRSGISESARFEVRESWSLGINGHFNEYAASEDSMEIAYQGNTSFNPEGPILVFDSDYKPGFEVGFVLNTPYDHWNIGGEYLWFQSRENLSKEADPTLFYISPLNIVSTSELISSLDSSWDLNINIGDLYLTRPYYSGLNLTIEPLMGLKAAFIKQDFDLSTTLFDFTWESQTVSTKTISWGIGPRLGLQANYLLGWGFSLFGDLSTSLLYTTYNNLRLDYANSAGISSFTNNNGAKLIQPVIDTGIGLSFGSYVGRKSFFINLTAAYNFSAFFSQNMGRSLVSVATGQVGMPANLYLQGVSLGLAFLF